jgi:WD40 repeat protein
VSASGECFDVAAALSFIDRDLPEEQCDLMERHVNRCRTCRELLAVAARLVNAEAAEPDEPEEAPDLPASERYTVLAEHDRGGQARILLAFDEKVGREVALKELLPGQGADDGSWRDAKARFLREAELTGQLVHPGVVPVFDIGRQRDGTLFYTMQLVRGRTLSKVLHERPRLQDRLSLLSHFLSVCHVVAYAHSRGVVHRDIKPQNIMVGEYGETVLLDWGLAKRRGDPELGRRSLRALSPPEDTQEGTIIGTPGYMSPEQASGMRDVDERSDIFGLGAVLWEILVGRPPARWLKAGLPADRSVRHLRGKAPPELVAVAEKALMPEREDRYQHASDLAQEITAFMTGGRVAAYAYTGWDLVRRFASRHRLLIGALAAIFAVILSALVLLSVAWRSERASRRASEASEKVAAARGRDALQEGARLAFSQGDLLQARAKLRGALELGDSLAARALWRRLRADPERLTAHFGSNASAVAFSPNSRELAIGLRNATLQILDTTTRAARTIRSGDDQVFSVAYSPDGKLLAWGTLSGRIGLWHTQGEVLDHLGDRGAPVYRIAFSPRGDLLAAAHDASGVVLWDVQRRSVRVGLTLPGKRATAVHFSPDGERLAVSGRGSETVVWNLETRAPVLELPGGRAHRTAFSVDGKLIASGGSDGSAYLWDARTGQLLRELQGHRAIVTQLAISPNGRWLASASADGTVNLRSLPEGDLVRTFSPTREVINDVAFSSDGALLAAVGAGAAWIWDVEEKQKPDDSYRPSRSLAVARFSPDGSRIASAGEDGTVRLWNGSGTHLSSWLEHEGPVYDLCFSPDGRFLASVGLDGALIVQDSQTGAVRQRLSAGHRVAAAVACAPGSRQVASAGSDGVIRIWDVAQGKLDRILESEAQSSPVYALLFADRGRLLLAGRQGRIEIWDVHASRLRRTLSGHTERLFALALDPKGLTLASSSADHSIRLWSMADGKGRVLANLPGRPYRLSWDPRGDRLAATTSAGEIAVWRFSSEMEMVPQILPAHGSEANSIEFGPDGRTAASAGDDGILRLWDTATWRPRWFTRAVIWAPTVQILTHLGWRVLDSSHRFVALDSPRTEAWRHAVETSRGAEMQPGGPLCAMVDTGLEIWDTESDQRLAKEEIALPFQVAAIAGGCSVLKDGKVTLFLPGRAPLELPGRAARQWGGERWVALGSEVLLLDLKGRELGSFGSGNEVTAAAGIDEQVGVGFTDGGIELRGRTERPRVHFQDTPESAVTVLAAGPAGTLVAGFANGSFGVWSTGSGERLERGAVHGAVRHLVLQNGVLLVASEVGATATLDLSALTEDYCVLLEQVWSRVPILWRDQGAVLQAPDSSIAAPACNRSHLSAAIPHPRLKKALGDARFGSP